MNIPVCPLRWVTVCLLLAHPFAAHSADVLINPGFESGVINWSGITASSTNINSGAGSGRIDQQPYFRQASQSFVCGPGDLVSFGGYIQTNSIVAGVAGLRVTFLDAANQSLQTVLAGTASGTGAFSLKEIEGVIPPIGTTGGRLDLYVENSATTLGTAYFDDLYVDVFSHKSTVVSSNGGFEEGYTGWYKGNATLTSGSNAFEGSYASALSHGSFFRQSWFEFPVNPAQEYAVSFAFATDAATSNGQVLLRYYNASASQIGSHTLIALAGTNPYTIYYADGLYPPAGATTGRLLFAAAHPGTGTSYLDNVLITTDQGGLVSPGFINQQLINLMPDSGFENGVSNWIGGVNVETINVAAGSQAGRFAGYNYYKSYNHALVAAQPGKYYALSILAALENIVSSPTVGLVFYDATGTTKLGEIGSILHVAGNTGYKPYISEYFQTPEFTAFIMIKVSIPSLNPGSFVYLDSVHLYEAQNLPVRAVSTYESIGVYASREAPAANEVAHLFFRESGTTVWSKGFAPVYDTGRKEYRGSIVNLAEGTNYEVQVVLEANGSVLAEAGTTVTTWSSTPPIQSTITVASLYTGGQMRIDGLHGSPEGWIRIVGTGSNDVDAGYGSDVALLVKNSSYLILDNIEIKGGRRHGVQFDMSDNVRLANCEISGWARQPNYSDGTYFYETLAEYNTGHKNLAINKDAGVHLYRSSQITIERCYVHDPRLGSNNWAGNNHPAGPSAIYVQNTIDMRMKGNFVVRYNDLVGSDDIRWNDVIEGENNGSDFGSFYRDSDIYGNMLCFANDDGAELDGGQMNVRFYGNRVESCYAGLSLAPCTLGPSYVYRNVFFNSGDDRDSSYSTMKLGGTKEYSKGKSFIFHNTLYTQENGITGVGFGDVKDPERDTFQAWSRNNIIQTLRNHANLNRTILDGEQHPWNSFDYDNLFSNGRTTANAVFSPGQEPNGILNDAPVFANASVGDFRLAAGSSGIDDGTVLFNFSAVFTGANPDQGALEVGASSLIPIRPIAVSADKYLINLTGTAGGSTTPVTVTLTTGSLGGSIGYTVRMNNTVNWLGVTPATGTLTSNGSTTLTFTLLSAGRTSGTQLEATILVRLANGHSIPITVNATVL